MSRRRAAAELAALAVGTALYLGLAARRSWVLDATLASLAAVAAAGAPRPARRGEVPPARTREAVLYALAVTLASAAVLLGLALARPRPVGGAAPSLLAGLIALGVYLPWAWVQQVLFQRYLLGRLAVLLPRVPPLGLAALDGVLFGAVHLPDVEVATLAGAAGVAWSVGYLRARLLWPVVASHALVGTAYFVGLRGHLHFGAGLARLVPGA